MEGVEMAAITDLVVREQSRDGFGRGRAVLEASLGIDRHVDAEDRAHTASHDFAFQRIETLMRPPRQLGKWNRLGDANHRRPRVRTESDKAVAARARIAAHASAAVAAGVSEGVLERLDPPAFLIEHAIVHDAASRQLAVCLDWLVLEVFT